MKSLRPICCALCVPVSLAALFAAACDGRLAVMDDPGVGGSSQLIETAGAGGTAMAGSGGMAGSAGSGGDAGSAGHPDAGPAPEPTPTCTDQLKNGDETGVDCGGPCAACQTPCDCASSPGLYALGCELSYSMGAVLGSSAHAPQLSATGEIVTFDLCYDDHRCQIFQSTQRGAARGMTVAGGATLAGVTPDGTRVLYSPQASLGAHATLSDFGSQETSTGLLPEPALLAANGTAFGLAATANDTSQLARKTPTGALEELGSLPFSRSNVALTGVSPDGSTIVGYGYDNSKPRPFRWTQAGGLVLDLPDLPENANGASVHAMSSDGSVFAGITWQDFTPVGVYRWSAAGGFSQAAPSIDFDLPGVDRTSMALSADGSALTGLMAVSDGAEFGAFRWTEATGAVAVAPGVQSLGTLLSADGSVLIGQTMDSSDYGAFVWTQAHGARVIRSTLESAGVDFRGWQISPPRALSADGRIAVGAGMCGGTPTMYRIVLPE